MNISLNLFAISYHHPRLPAAESYQKLEALVQCIAYLRQGTSYQCRDTDPDPLSGSPSKFNYCSSVHCLANVHANPFRGFSAKLLTDKQANNYENITSLGEVIPTEKASQGALNTGWVRRIFAIIDLPVCLVNVDEKQEHMER